MYARELQRLGRTAVKLDVLAHRLGFESVEALCVAATKEEFSLRSIEQALKVAPPPGSTPSTEPTEAAAKNAAISPPRRRLGKWLAISAEPTAP